MTAVETGITDIIDVLASIGVDVVRAGEREITGRCPVHERMTGHADRSPSWSMNATTGAWICFSCGAKGSLMGLVQELTGSTNIAYDFYATVATLSLNNLDMPKVTPKISVDWVSYNKFSDVPDEELHKRQLTRASVDAFGIRWDPTETCWVLPLVSPTNDLLGWQSKKSGWVRNYPVGVKKSETLFGINKFRGGRAILLESPLDAVRLHSIGSPYQGLATFGTAVSSKQISILEQKADSVIVAMDNDDAGISSSKKLKECLPRFRNGVYWLNYTGTTAKDIGDMTNDEIFTAIETASAIPGYFV